jgi:hypothetical protein
MEKEFVDSWWRSASSEAPYPSEDLIGRRGGMKVAWLLYSSEEGANACSPVAYAEGVKWAREGYDFGYQCPGSVRKVADGWEVVIP